MSKVYTKNKQEFAYNLFVNKKTFKKCRAFVIKNNKLLLIKVTYKNGKPDHFLLPGGGVDENESIKQAIVRETLEEYNVLVSPITYIGRNHYSVPIEFEDEKFLSKCVEHYYICQFEKTVDSNNFGIDGEFDNEDRIYQKVELSLTDLEKISAKDLNNISQKAYDKLIAFMKSLN